MKKIKLILCLTACILGLTACGEAAEEKVLDTEVAAALETLTQGVITECYAQLPADQAEEFVSYGPEYMEYVFENYFGMQVDGNAIISGFTSWNGASAEIGDFQSVTGMSAAYDEQGKDIIVKVDIAGTKKTAQVEAMFKDNMDHTLTSIAVNVNYTFGEKMERAALNTLMGMGTVFIVLIIIILVISLFGLIPKIQAAFGKKEEKSEQAVAADPTVQQIIAKEELTDDLELIAVITAAIAASGTSGSADDFVVRSIRRKADSQWNRA